MIKHFIIATFVAAFALLVLIIQTNNNGIAKAETPDHQNEQKFDQTKVLAELRNKIADLKDKPSEEVFKNIQILKGVPAGRLLSIMEYGYSKSLGVDCTHCHVVDQWEKDDKPTKQITQEMALMVRAINGEYLSQISNLKSEKPTVNCTTCHRGQIKPALNLQ